MTFQKRFFKEDIDDLDQKYSFLAHLNEYIHAVI